MELASLRAEIKTWEREFRSKHSRDPTIDEIRQLPAIAAKYKLYKSLSKAASVDPPAARMSMLPKHQPRQATQSPTSSLLSKSRPVKTDPPAVTTNPFSPTKKKGRGQHPSPNLHQSLKLPQRVSNGNPFTTPTKSRPSTKSKPSAPRRSPSPDPFPPVQSSQPQAPPLLTPTHETAVVRARKRLRGEPVSPSPVKGKRARIGSQRTLNFSTTLLDSDDETSHPAERTANDADETFLEATPMKPPPGGKSFPILFDELLPGSQQTTRPPPQRSLSRAKSVIVKPSIIGEKRAKSRALSPSSGEDDDDNWETRPKLKGLITSVNSLAGAKHDSAHPKKLTSGAGNQSLPRAVLPGKDDLWSDVGPSKGASLKHQQAPVPTSAAKLELPSRSTAKRRLSDERSDRVVDGPNGPRDGSRAESAGPFLPPSPPPADSSNSYTGSTKGKGKDRASTTFSRKKVKLLEQLGGDAEDSLEDDEGRVKVVERAWHTRNLRAARLIDGIDDPDLDWPPRTSHETPFSRPETSVDPGTLEIHLPDDLKRILALSPEKDPLKEEERLAKGLIYGRRECHYDTKKGEIWDVGEMSEDAEGGEATEEDWEGEPVPWEVAEL